MPNKDVIESAGDFEFWSTIVTIKGSLEKIANTQILSEKYVSSPLFEAAVTLFLVQLNDGFALMEKSGFRADHTGDDIHVVGKEGDITSLIREARNAACHVGSRISVVERSNKVRFCVMSGKGTLIDFGTSKLENPYDDDAAIFYGNLRLFLVRNMQVGFDILCDFIERNAIAPFKR